MSDLSYEKQILEANKLGNSLLSGLIHENLAGNKINATISSRLKDLHETTASLVDEINKLK